MVHKIISSIKSLIYPPKCVLCGKVLEDKELDNLCEKCKYYVLNQQTCQKCGRPYNMGKERCLFCENEDLSYIERIIALFPYKEVCRESVLRWKYKGLRKYAKLYAKLFVYDLKILDKISIDGLIPVPIAPSRLKKRGFNQALDLANEISNLTGITVYDCLERQKNTKPQSQCNRSERLKNIIGTINLKGEASDYPELKQIAIIDDIYTTGATVKECIKVVRKNLRLKNENIYLLIVCIGL